MDNLHADGLNIVNNNGQQAGQAIEHIHFHLIPRYKDDDYLIKGQEHKYDLKEVLQIVKGLKRWLVATFIICFCLFL